MPATTAGFVTTNRASTIRVSPHGHNTAAKIDALVELLEARSGSGRRSREVDQV